ncbi:MAG: V-type ATP synthase subunit D [Synergistales bacterium]|nr:V-type ATP synthase subunit D [Synergistales bacterium]
MGVAGNEAPTRGNMVQAEGALKLAVQGHDLLERKRQVLMMELVGRIRESRRVQERLRTVFENAYRSLQMANLSLGIDMVEEIADAVPEEEGFAVRLHSVMGVEVPDVDAVEPDPRPCYSFYGTSGAMDNAYLQAREMLALLARLAEVENSVYRLAVQIRKTYRRVNALEKVVIPSYRETIATIADVLEESDREDFVRMKIAKKTSPEREEG